jgi:hypothetical protein
MRTRATGILTLATMITTAIWAAIMVIDGATAEPITTLAEKIDSLGKPEFLFTFNYVNATLITLLDVAMFTAFYLYCRDDERFWSTVAAAFIPIYGLGNLMAYLSQVFVVPRLLALYRVAETASTAEVLLGLTLHTWPGSVIEALNGLSYAILGIPSIILGVLMYRKAKGLRVGSVLLALSGVLSITAFVGVGLGSAVLAGASPFNGLVFMVSLILIGVFFLRQPAGKVD